MINPDEFYKNIERNMSKGLSTTGEMENAFWQHLGHFYNKDVLGTSFEDSLGHIERVMTGQHGNRWDGQNKKTDMEKAVEKYKKENNLDK